VGRLFVYHDARTDGFVIVIVSERYFMSVVCLWDSGQSQSLQSDCRATLASSMCSLSYDTGHSHEVLVYVQLFADHCFILITLLY